MDATTALTVIPVTVGVCTLLHLLLEKRKNERIEFLKDQLKECKDSSPDVLVERYSKKITLLTSELKELEEKDSSNTQLIKSKEEELKTVQTELQELRTQMERAQLLLEDLEYLKSKVECPYCEAPLSSMTNVEFCDTSEGTAKSYECGYSEVEGYLDHPCPADPKYPKIEDYELITEYNNENKQWTCFPKPKTTMAAKILQMRQPGRTEEEAKQRVIDKFNWWPNEHRERFPWAYKKQRETIAKDQ